MTTRIAIIKKTEQTSVGKDVEKLELPDITGGDVKSCNYLKVVWQSVKTLNIQLPFEPSIPLLATSPREMKT